MIKNKFNFIVFSMAFFILLVLLACTPATEAFNNFISGLCLGFLLSQAVFLLWVQESNSSDELTSPPKKEKPENYLNEYWWNDGKMPNINKEED